MTTVLREDVNGIAFLTLNRPDKLNALNVAIFEDLQAHVDAIRSQMDQVGCVVMRGAGKCFSAGHDLADISAGEELPEPHFQARVIERLSLLPQPVITAVHGHCYTGALELALAGDIILASETAKFADTHAKWALTPLWGLSQRLPRRIGQSKATEMMITCQTYSGADAERMGLANRCFAESDFEEEVFKFAEAVVHNSWFSHRANKSLIFETDGMPLPGGLAHETYKYMGRGPDYKQRVDAFLNKKK